MAWGYISRYATSSGNGGFGGEAYAFPASGSHRTFGVIMLINCVPVGRVVVLVLLVLERSHADLWALIVSCYTDGLPVSPVIGAQFNRHGDETRNSRLAQLLP